MRKTDKTVRGSFAIRSGRKGLLFFCFTAIALIASAVFLLWPNLNEGSRVSARVQSAEAGRAAEIFNQVVRLGGSGGYAVYAENGVTATEDTLFRGAVGTGVNGELKGVRDANRGNTDIDLGAVRADLGKAFSALRQLPYEPVLDGRISGKTFGAGFYSVSTAKLEGELVFDGQGDSNSILVIRVDGRFEAAAGSRIRLINGAQAFNVHIVVEGDALIGAGADLPGNIIARDGVEARQGSTVKGRIISIGGVVTATGAELGGGTGRVQICKVIQPNTTLPAQTFTFTFAAVGGGTETVSIPAGVCSGPREVASGNLTVTETYNGTFAVSGASAVRVGGVPVPGVTFNSPAGTVVVPVLEGDLNNETTLTVVNQPIRGGFFEICKLPSSVTAPVDTPELGGDGPSSDDPVSGVFEFTFRAFPGGPLLSAFVPLGGCSLPLQVTSFTPSTTTTSFVTRITEVGRAGVLLERVETYPEDRLVGTGGGIGTIGAGGYADVTILVGNAGSQVIVGFFNRSAPGEIKVCKIAGPGVPVNTPFTFDVTGTVPGGTLTAPTFPGAIDTFTVTVPAGPGPEGYCLMVRNRAGTANQTFVIGTRVLIAERPLSVSGAPAIVTRIDELNAGAPVSESLGAGGSVSFGVQPGIGVASFTNIRFAPAVLKICKIGTGAASTGTFTFDLSPAANHAGAFEDGFTFGTVSVPAGSCSLPFAGFPSNVDILVDERAAAGIVTTAINAQPGAGTIVSRNLALGQGTIDITDTVTANEIIFTNGTAPTTPVALKTEFDFDGDGKADPTVFRPSDGSWWMLGTGSGLRTTVFGIPSDVIVPADYDGDGKTDYAIYRNGEWHVLGSNSGYAVRPFGLPGDIPQPGDYDGDGRADLAVYRPADGTWYVFGSRDGFRAVKFGISTDLPVAADFDGDGKYDPAVYRNGTWYILGSEAGFSAYQFGLAADRPVPADYDGDGKADPAVYRNGTWYLLRSTAGFTAGTFGLASDKPVPADYDGDRKADLAVFRPAGGVWHVMRSSMTESDSAYTAFTFGMETDTPIPY